MIRLEDNNTTPDNSNPSLNDLTTLKTLQEGERAPTPASIVVRRSLIRPTADLVFDNVFGHSRWQSMLRRCQRVPMA